MERKIDEKKNSFGRDNQDTILRCLNCFTRLSIPPKAERVVCRECGVEYMIGWRGKVKQQAKIKGTPIPGKHT